jgi:hypothetical protein
MMTIVPQRKRPISASTKKQTVTPVTDMIIVKPIRHLAILPSSKEPSNKGNRKNSTDLSGINRSKNKSYRLMFIYRNIHNV